MRIRYSKLSDHTFKKGKFITPLNTLPQAHELEDERSWTYGRMPEYLWIGLLLNYYGREEGLRKSCDIVFTLHKLAPELFSARLSQILKMDTDIQKRFYDYIKDILPKIRDIDEEIGRIRLKKIVLHTGGNAEFFFICDKSVSDGICMKIFPGSSC